MDDILYPLHSFKEQFSFEPTIVNEESLLRKKIVIICGMGGSAICVSLLKILFPELNITLYNNYGLPDITNKDETFIILNSYSGNTEEIIDTFDEIEKVGGISTAVLSRGGELISKAVYTNIPHIVLPSIGIEPRFAIGHQLLGLLALMGEQEKIIKLKDEVSKCDIVTAENNGKQLATGLKGKYPIIYASKNLYPVGYLIKAAINEGPKLPCFVSVIPEANHNEIQSFVSKETKKEIVNFAFVFLTSHSDHPRVQRRFKIMTELYGDEGFAMATLDDDHTNHTKVFELILTGYFTATYLAIERGVDAYKTPFIQEFKQRMS